MRRRKVLKQIGATTAATIGATGLAAADSDGIDREAATHVSFENERGEVETVEIREAVGRADAPSLQDIGTAECCDSCTDCLCRQC